jgi:hypothetical protein
MGAPETFAAPPIPRKTKLDQIALDLGEALRNFFEC